MVGDPLKVSDAVKEQGDRMAVVLGKLLASYLYHIGSQMVLVLIHQVLDGSYLVGLFLVIGVQELHGL